MENRYLGKITKEFRAVYKELKKERVIEDVALSRPAENNLHSWLQYALVIAGERAGLRAATEIKLRFTEPLDPNKYRINRRRRKHSRVDVAFYKNDILIGIAEVHTINDAYVYLPTEEFVNNNVNFLSDRDVLLHTIRYSESQPKFVLLIVTLPKKASRIPWLADMRKVKSKIASDLQGNKNFYEAFKDGWREFKDAVEREVRCSLVIISEDEKVEII